MDSQQVCREHRGAQRFQIHLPIRLQRTGESREESGLAQDVSASGVFLYSDFTAAAGSNVELTFVMPTEITLAESMRVRCRGTVLRVMPPQIGSNSGIAVHFDTCEFLPELAGAEASRDFNRIASLHTHAHE